MKRVVSEPIHFYWLGLGGVCSGLNSSEQMAADAIVLPCSCIFAIVEYHSGGKRTESWDCH